MTTDPNVRAVIEALDGERIAQGLTINEHAERIGISSPTYFRIKRGQINRTTRLLLRLALSREIKSFDVAVPA